MTDLFSSREAEACVEGADSGRKNHAHFPTVTLGGHWKICVTSDFLEAVAEIEKLPDIDATTGPYLLTLSRSGVPTSAFVTLIPHANGTWSATIGDLRESSEVARDDSGLPILFPDEDAACRWAVAKVRSARSAAPADAQEMAQAVIDGHEMECRFRELEEAEGRERS